MDCGQFLIACYRAAGAIEEPTIAPYPRDWNLNRDEPRFLNALLEYCVTTDTPQAGDIAMFKYGRHAAHGAIYLEDERIIHAWLDQGGVVITDLTSCGIASRLAGYYTLKERA